MANKQINELSELTTLAVGDLIPVYDIDEAGSEKTKQITAANFSMSGNFTPEIADAATGGNTATPGSAGGYYRRIGDIVHIHITVANINTTGLTSGNVLYIRNLPFPVGSVAYSHVGTAWVQSVTVNGFSVVARMSPASSTIILQENTNGGSHSSLTVADFTDDQADVIIDMTYFA